MSKNFDSRQSEHRSALNQLTGTDANKTLKQILPAIDSEATPSFALRANDSGNDLQLNVGAGRIANPETLRNRQFSPINKQSFSFTGGTVLFPATSGGAITVTPGVNETLTVNNNEYVNVLVQINSVGDMSVAIGDSFANIADVADNVPAHNTGDLPIGYITLFNNAGTIDNVADSAITQFIGGGGAGAGSGAGGGISPAEGFDLLFFDELSNGPSSPDNLIDASLTTGVHLAAQGMYQLSCDKAPTITTVGTACTLSVAPAFTVQVNDIVYSGTEWRRIDAVTDQQTFTLDAAFSSDLTAASGMISQALYTVDMVNFGDAVEETRARDLYPSEALSSANVIYFDTLALADGVEDFMQQANIAVSLSNEGLQADVGLPSSSTFGSTFERALVSESQPDYALPENTNKERLFAVFFCNPNKAAVTTQANLLEYRISFVESLVTSDAGFAETAFGYTDASSGEDMSIGVFGGKTRIVLDWEYPANVLSTESQGALEVRLDGLVLPRFISGVTTDAYFQEIDSKTIDLDSDYSGQNLSIEVVYRQAVVDTSDDNSKRLSDVEIQQSGNVEWSENGFEDHISKSIIDAPFTEIENRAQIKSGLEATMGIERIMCDSQLELVNGESGPNDKLVYREGSDSLDRIRMVGNWRNTHNLNGSQYITTDVDDFCEVTFYGTGLNLLSYADSSTRDILVTIDGGSENPTSIRQPSSATISGRNYDANTIYPVASGLSLGWHTIKLRLSVFAFVIQGFEILNESTQINVAPGTGFGGTKREILRAQSAIDFKPAAMTGTKGGRVVTYLLNEELAQAFTEVPASPLFLTSADHSDEELVRKINFREFGANRSDDFSNVTGTQDAFFTLDDGTTILTGEEVRTTSGVSEGLGPNGPTDFIEITFVGTGLDIIREDNATGGSDTYELSVDGVLQGNLRSSGIQRPRLERLCSGLPYGSHTVRITRQAVSTFVLNVKDFLIYQPKKPSTPLGAVELADYNVMANFVVNDTTLDTSAMSQGVMRKHCTKEFLYVEGSGGSADWAVSTANPVAFVGGATVFSNRTNAYIEYTFFGTGFDFRASTGTNYSGNSTVTLNGTLLTAANFPTASFTNLGVVTYNTATAVLNQDFAQTFSAGFSCSGLPLGVYTIRINNNTTDFLEIDVLDIHTPIHVNDTSLNVGNTSMKSQQNVGPVIKEEAKPKIGEAKVLLNYDAVNQQVRNSHNVEAVLELATGVVEVWYAVPFKDNNYYYTVGSLDDNANICSDQNRYRTYSIRLFLRNSANALADQDFSLAIFGKLQGEE